jgi:hypothetical protein
MFVTPTYYHHFSMLLLHGHMLAAVGPVKGQLQQTADVDLKRARCVADPLDAHRSSVAVAECDADGPLAELLVDLAYTCCECRCNCV